MKPYRVHLVQRNGVVLNTLIFSCYDKVLEYIEKTKHLFDCSDEIWIEPVSNMNKLDLTGDLHRIIKDIDEMDGLLD